MDDILSGTSKLQIMIIIKRALIFKEKNDRIEKLVLILCLRILTQSLFKCNVYKVNLFTWI